MSGEYLRGWLAANDIPAKAIADKSGIHGSTISRIFTGAKQASETQIFQIGVAAGAVQAERRTKKEPHRLQPAGSC
jgi:hypothetical protein